MYHSKKHLRSLLKHLMLNYNPSLMLLTLQSVTQHTGVYTSNNWNLNKRIINAVLVIPFVYKNWYIERAHGKNIWFKQVENDYTNSLKIVSLSENLVSRLFLFYCSSLCSEKVKRYWEPRCLVYVQEINFWRSDI